MAAERIELDVSKALADIARLKGGLADIKKEVGAVGVAADAAFDEGFALGMVDALDDLQKEYAEMARAAKVLQNAMRGATEPALVKTYAQSIAQLETGMRKLETTAKSAGVSLKQANKEAGTGKQVFEGFFGAFTKATVIIAAIEAVRRFASQAIDLATQTKKASLQFEAFLGSAEKAQKVVGELQSFAGKKLLPTQEVLDAGKGLLAFGVAADRLTPTLSQIADISKATGKNFGELTTIFGKAKAAGVLYAEDINQLVDAGIPIIGEFKKQLGVSTDQVKKLASEGKISFEELQLAFFNLTAEGGKFAGQAEAGADAGDRFNVAWTNALTKVGVALKPAWDFVLDSLTGILDSVTKLASSTGITSFAENTFRAMAKLTPAFAVLEKITDKLSGKTSTGIDENADKAALDADRRAYEENLNERERLEKEAQAARNRRNKTNTAEAAKLEKELARLRIDAMAEGMEKEIAQENLRFTELKKQLDRYHIDASGAIDQHNKNILGIELKYTLQRIAAENKLIELRKAEAEYEQKQSDKSLAAKKKFLEQTREIRESEVDITEAEFNNLLKALEAGGAKKEDIEKAQLQFDEQIQAQRLQSRIDFLKGILAITDQGNKAEITLITNQIAALQTQLDGLGQGVKVPGGNEPKGLLELIGLNLDPDELEGLKAALKDVQSIFSDFSGAQVDAADAAIEAAQKQIQAAQILVDEQKKLADQGYANNLSDAQRSLDAAKAQEQKAFEQKKAAQRQQSQLDTIAQASAIATASAKIFQQIPFPLSAFFVAAMIGAFIAAKARAAKAAKFKHGGEGRVDGNSIIVGASHDGGGVGIEAEGGEFFGTDGKRFGVVNKRMTKKHFELLSAINRDDRDKMREALENLTRPNMNRDAVMNAIGESGGTVVIRGGSDKKTHGLLSDIKRNGQRSRTVEGGYVVERNGNHVKKTKIK